eukprot:3254948-Alexandrium_andersonii.AAC.1
MTERNSAVEALTEQARRTIQADPNLQIDPAIQAFLLAQPRTFVHEHFVLPAAAGPRLRHLRD